MSCFEVSFLFFMLGRIRKRPLFVYPTCFRSKLTVLRWRHQLTWNIIGSRQFPYTPWQRWIFLPRHRSRGTKDAEWAWHPSFLTFNWLQLSPNTTADSSGQDTFERAFFFSFFSFFYPPSSSGKRQKKKKEKKSTLTVPTYPVFLWSALPGGSFIYLHHATARCLHCDYWQM